MQNDVGIGTPREGVTYLGEKLLGLSVGKVSWGISGIV